MQTVNKGKEVIQEETKLFDFAVQTSVANKKGIPVNLYHRNDLINTFPEVTLIDGKTRARLTFFKDAKQYTFILSLISVEKEGKKKKFDPKFKDVERSKSNGSIRFKINGGRKECGVEEIKLRAELLNEHNKLIQSSEIPIPFRNGSK
jgi:hypothetical protein